MCKFLRKALLVVVAGMSLTNAALAQNTQQTQPAAFTADQLALIRRAEQSAAGLPEDVNPITRWRRVQAHIDASNDNRRSLRDQVQSMDRANQEFEDAWHLAWDWAFYSPTGTLRVNGNVIPSGSRRDAGIDWLQYLILKQRSLRGFTPLHSDEIDRLERHLNAERGRGRFLTGGFEKKGFWNIHRPGQAQATGRRVVFRECENAIGGTWQVVLDDVQQDIEFSVTAETNGFRVVGEKVINNRKYRIDGTLRKVNRADDYVELSVELRIYYVPAAARAFPNDPQFTHRGSLIRWHQ